MVHRLLLVSLMTLVVTGCGSTGPTPSGGSTHGIPTSASPGADGASGSAPATRDAAVLARSFVDALSRGDTAAAEAMEDATMRSAAPAGKLGSLWQSFVQQFGAFQGLGGVQTVEQPPYTNATVETWFADATVPLLVTISADGLVAGLHLGAPGPARSPGSSGSATSTPQPAAYVDPAAFTETEVTVGSPPWTLPGTLSLPNGPGPFPGVVLVAGSGPQDRDETIGPNKPLRDLAWGLASAGIAVIRYDKRTLVYASEMAAQLASLTVRQETIDDAVAAIDQLRTVPKVDPDRVFVAGHSLGGYLAPRIAADVPGRLHGIALLEANSTPLPQLILLQSEYLASLQRSPGPSVDAQLEALRAQVALAESPDLSASTPASQLPLGIPASYWLDLRAHDPLTIAAGLDLPMLLTQGGRDYQVPPTELDGWRRALAARSNVIYELYPALDHLLFAGSGPSTPAEYSVPSHVAPEVIRDLSAWISGT